MKRIKWYIGLDKLDASFNHQHTIWNETRRELIEAYGGFTETRAEGGWMNPQSKQISLEPTVIFEVITSDIIPWLIEAVRRQAETFKVRFEQESVLFTLETLDHAEFVI